jgi:hypothetical protein
MTWATLAAVRLATRLNFAAWLAARHTFVHLPSGRWSRVLGAPAPEARHVRGRVYHLPAGAR